MQRVQQLAALLVDDTALAAWTGADLDEGELWTLAAREGVDCLLAQRLLGEGGESARHDGTRRTARDVLARATIVEELRRRELARLTGGFAEREIRMLLLKGAAWAYTVYPTPALRPRVDTDLFIDVKDREPTERLLIALGYQPAVESVTVLASAQRHYSYRDDFQIAHFVDLHWRLTNPLVFADAMPFARLWARSVAVAPLGDARTLGAADALLLACLHRLAHHGDDSALIWLMDIHLLASAMAAGEWADFVAEAEASRLRGVCAQSLRRASDRFGTRLPAEVVRWLAASPSAEVETVFLGRGVSPLGVLASDWRAVGSWRERLRLLRDHAVPSPTYMRARYGSRHGSWMLPLLYLGRAVSGLRRWATSHRQMLLSRTSSTARQRSPKPPEGS